MSRLPVNVLGFHVSDLTWDTSSSEYPLDRVTLNIIDNCVIKDGGTASLSPIKPHQISIIALKRLLFNTTGLVGRGTRVWKGLVISTGGNVVSGSPGLPGTLVAVKFSWRNTLRPLEATIYELASSQGVVGITTLIHSSSYGKHFPPRCICSIAFYYSIQP